MNIINWEKPLFNLKLLDNEVHLWKANLKISRQQIKELNNSLSADEKARAERFHFPEHRNRFIAARGFLREIISSYLEVASQEIIFNYSDRGKPNLSNNKLQFNISHSQDIALYGFINNCLIGIDVEYLREDLKCDQIATRFFSDRESQLIKSSTKEQQTETFFHLWTAKEAYLKATGEGLIGGLDTVEIEIKSTSEVKLLASGDGKILDDWFLYSFIPHQNFIANLAINTKNPSLKIKSFVLN